jgi:hypothetical protein
MTPDAGQLPARIDPGEAMLLLTSWIQLLLQWQQDWTRSATYVGATGVLTSLGGSYGLALPHAWDMLASPAATGQQTVNPAR